MNKTLKTLVLISTCLHFSAGLFNPLYALFVEAIGGTVTQIGFTYATMPAIVAIGLIISGKVTDKTKNEKYYLIAGYVLKTAGFFSLILVNSIAQLILVQAIFGFSYIITTPAYASLYSKNLTQGKYASNWSAWEAATHIAGAVSAIVGSIILSRFDFATLFITMGIFSTIGVLISLTLKNKV